MVEDEVVLDARWQAMREVNALTYALYIAAKGRRPCHNFGQFPDSDGRYVFCREAGCGEIGKNKRLEPSNAQRREDGSRAVEGILI